MQLMECSTVDLLMEKQSSSKSSPAASLIKKHGGRMRVIFPIFKKPDGTVSQLGVPLTVHNVDPKFVGEEKVYTALSRAEIAKKDIPELGISKGQVIKEDLLGNVANMCAKLYAHQERWELEQLSKDSKYIKADDDTKAEKREAIRKKYKRDFKNKDYVRPPVEKRQKLIIAPCLIVPLHDTEPVLRDTSGEQKPTIASYSLSNDRIITINNLIHDASQTKVFPEHWVPTEDGIQFGYIEVELNNMGKLEDQRNKTLPTKVVEADSFRNLLSASPEQVEMVKQLIDIIPRNPEVIMRKDMAYKIISETRLIANLRTKFFAEFEDIFDSEGAKEGSKVEDQLLIEDLKAMAPTLRTIGFKHENINDIIENTPDTFDEEKYQAYCKEVGIAIAAEDSEKEEPVKVSNFKEAEDIIDGKPAEELTADSFEEVKTDEENTVDDEEVVF